MTLFSFGDAAGSAPAALAGAFSADAQQKFQRKKVEQPVKRKASATRGEKEPEGKARTKRRKVSGRVAGDGPAATAAAAGTNEEAETVGDLQSKEDMSQNGVSGSSQSQDQREQQEQEARTVFVGNLPLDIKKKELVRLFAQFGEVHLLLEPASAALPAF